MQGACHDANKTNDWAPARITNTRRPVELRPWRMTRTADLERLYADQLVRELRRLRRALIEHVEVVGSYPDSELRITFRVHDRLCLYGVIDRIWDEETPESYDPSRAVTNAYLRWLEALDTGELPHACHPDSDGVTWLRLWEDWQ